jgi:uncharacterized membrane protein
MSQAMDGMFGSFLLLIAGSFLIALILGVIAFARTFALQREIATLRRSLQTTEQPVQAPSADRPAAEVSQPMAYSYDAPVDTSPPERAREPLPYQPVPTVTTNTRFPTTDEIDAAASTTHDARPVRANLEDVIGGKWLNAVGLLAVLLGTAFFLKYAFDNNWIGPVGRIALGLVAGSAVLVVSEWIYRRGWIYFSEGLTALGAAILFLSLYAAWNFYHLIAPEAAFAGLAVVTALLIAIALRRDSQRLATLALLGGYATPLLVSTGHDAQVPLFSYLTLLNGGLLWMAIARDWRALSLSFVFTLLYGVIWYTHFYDPTKLAASLIFASIFFLQFASLPAVLARRDGILRPDSVALTLLNAGWYLFALDTMLYGSHRWLLTAAVLATSVLFLMLTSVMPRRSEKGQALARPIFGTIAFALITVAIPIRLQGQWIDMAWAVEGALLVWTGLRLQTAWLRWNGVAVLVVVAVYLFASPIDVDRAFLNGRFATFLVVVAAFGAVRWLSQRYASILEPSEESGYRAFGIAANAFAVYELSAETLRAIPYGGSFSGATAALQAGGLTLVWVMYAVVLAAFAYIRNSGLVRWQAWILFALVICKAPVADFIVATGAYDGLAGFRALVFLVAVGAMALALFLSRRHTTPAAPAERSVFMWLEVAINVYAVWALSVVVTHALSSPTFARALLPGQVLDAQLLAVTLAWTLYALGLATYAYRRGSDSVRWQAWCLFALVLLKAPVTDFSTEVAPHTALWYLRMVVFAFVFGAMLVTLVLGRRGAPLSDNAKTLLRALEVAVNIYGVWACSLIIWQGFSGPPASASVTWSAAQQLGLSLAWTIYAVALIGVGVWRDSALIRWQALALFALVIIKAFFFDLSLLAVGYRIASFLVLGLMLLGASFLYQRRLFRRQPQEPPA